MAFWSVEQLGYLLEHHTEQRRIALVPEPVLMTVAQARVEDMIARQYFSHTDPDGYGPNYHVRATGWPLPDWYGQEPAANNIESIAAGYPMPEDVIRGLSHSPGHWAHLMGLIDFFKEQDSYGIGYAFNDQAKYRYYWAIIIAKKDIMVSGE